MTLQEIVEKFHLIFLLFMTQKLNRKYYALKGGCNMRFFFKSPRYSEDIDLDIQEIPLLIFKDEINKILKSRAFKDMLANTKIKIEHITEHKQTETTQRWKFGLLYNHSKRLIPTRIEFSRRDDFKEGVSFEAVDNNIIDKYDLPPILINHYTKEEAMLQKLNAISSRKITQARDIFDIYILITTTVFDVNLLKNLNQETVSKIKENIFSLDYSTFKSQVISYLQPDDLMRFDSEETWDMVRLKIVELIEKGEQ